MPGTLKRFSLGRLFASLRPKRDSSPSSFPVQTGFPTSIADIVVKNNGRLGKPRRSSAPSPQNRELFPGGHDPANNRKWKWKRSLKKLISKKKRETKDSLDQPEDDGAGDVADRAAKSESFSTEQTSPEPGIELPSSSSSRAESVVVVVDERRPVRFPLSVLLMVILAGLVAGIIPTTVLTVLCVVLFSGAV